MQNGRDDLFEGGRREGEVEKVTDLVKRVRLKFVQVQYLSISVFLKKNGLTDAMLVAHRNVIIECELQRRRDLPALTHLSDHNLLPLIFPALVHQLQKDSIHVLVY